MIISDLNYLEITSEEIIGGGYNKPTYNKPVVKYLNEAFAGASADATGAFTLTITDATATTSPGKSSSKSSAAAVSSSKPI